MQGSHHTPPPHLTRFSSQHRALIYDKEFDGWVQTCVSLLCNDFLALGRIPYVTDGKEVFLLRILQVPASNLERNTGYP
jgi:hypothetical protein